MSLRNCLKIRNSLTVMSFKSCVLTSDSHHLYCRAITVVNAIPRSSVGSNEILVIVYQKMPGSSNDVQ